MISKFTFPKEIRTLFRGQRLVMDGSLGLDFLDLAPLGFKGKTKSTRNSNIEGEGTWPTRPSTAKDNQGSQILFNIQENQIKATRFHLHSGIGNTTLSLLGQKLKGVSQGFIKDLELVGVGLRVSVSQQQTHALIFRLGYTNPIHFLLPSGVLALKTKPNQIRLFSTQLPLLTQTCIQIINLRQPDSYKGKGISQRGQKFVLKPGKKN